MRDPVPPSPLDEASRRRAWVRFLLGNAQMFFAVVTMVVLVKTGLNAVSVTLAVFTTALTLTSVAMRRGWIGARAK